MMQVRHLQLSHGTRILCPDVTFHVDAGELILLAGPNGSGKTTLLRQLAVPEGASEICSHPRLHKREGPAKREARTFGRGREATISEAPSGAARCIFVPTGIPKVKGFTVEEFIRTGCYRESDWAGRLRGAVRERMEAVLALLGLDAQRGQDLSTLSDGEFQKACIAVGLTLQAPVLLLDEPTAYLDVDNRLMVLQTLARVVAETGTAIVFSSHDLHDAVQVAHRVLAITPDGAFLESTTRNKAEVLRSAFPAWQG